MKTIQFAVGQRSERIESHRIPTSLFIPITGFAVDRRQLGCAGYTRIPRVQHAPSPWRSNPCAVRRAKKADVAEHPQAFDHVGLLFNGPPGSAGLLLIKSSDEFCWRSGRSVRETRSGSVRHRHHSMRNSENTPIVLPQLESRGATTRTTQKLSD